MPPRLPLPPTTVHGRILLVDGNVSGLSARKAVLEENGHTVSVASSGADAFEQFSGHKFDLVVTDHKMPRMDGLGLIKKIHAVSPETPMVLLSGLVDVLGLDEQTTGANAVIQKSANEVTQMVRVVARLLRRKPLPKKAASQGSALTKSKRIGA